MKYNENIPLEIIALGEELEKYIKSENLIRTFREYSNRGYRYITIDFFRYISVHKTCPIYGDFDDWWKEKEDGQKILHVRKGSDLSLLCSHVTLSGRLFQF